MEVFIGIFTEPWKMGLLIALLAILFLLKDGNLIPMPRKKKRWGK